MPQREPVRFPNGERVALYLVVNVEEWNIEKPVAREYVTGWTGLTLYSSI